MQLEDIKKLANLARIDMNEEEMKEITRDFDSILAYVGQVQEALKVSTGKVLMDKKRPEDYFSCNVVRDDVVTNNHGEYTEAILADAPDTQDGFLKVKQIL